MKETDARRSGQNCVPLQGTSSFGYRKRASKGKAFARIGSGPVYPFWCALFFYLFTEGLAPTASEGMSTSGLMTRSFRHPRARWAMKRVSEKAKTRSIGHGSVRDDYVLRVQANEVCAILVQGLGCRLGRCFCALHRGVHRTPAPFSRNQIKTDTPFGVSVFIFMRRT